VLLLEGEAGIGKTTIWEASLEFKHMIKRAARRGIETRGGYVGIGRDNACFPNRFHSRRSFTLVP
jgi:hypothetical protein